MDIRTQTALLAAIVNLALAVSMLLRPGRPRVITLYSTLGLGIAAYYLGDFLFALTDHDVWRRVSLGFGAVVPALALAFFMEFLEVTPRRARRGQAVAALVALFGAAVALTPLGRIPAARVAVAACAFAALTASLSLLVSRRAATDSRIDRARLTYLWVGAAAAVVFSATDLLVRFDVPFPTVGPLVTTLYLYFLAQTIHRLRLLDLNELLGKVVALSVLALILTLIYGVLVYWVGERPGLFLFETLVASFVILILVEPLRAKVEAFVASTMFRERFEMIHRLNALRARTQSIIDVHELARVVLDALEETRRVTHASLYLLADDRPGFRLLDHRGPAPAAFVDATAARGLLFAASSGQKAVLVENVDRRVAELRATAQPESRRVRDEVKRLTETRGAMREMLAGITVPLSGQDRVIGFLNLEDERVAEAYASNEIAVVLDVAERIAIAVENSKLYERIKERDRLAALGEMAAGLAHEIRNPLGAIKGAAQVLDPQGTPADSGDLLRVIVEEVNRLNKVVSEFLDYARPLKQNFAPTDVNDVVSRTAKLMQGEQLPPDIEVRLELADALPRMMGDAEQLRQVVLNLMLNAVQAMPKGGTLTLCTARPDEAAWRDFRAAPEMVELRVRDTGKGIPEEHRPNIFVPFFTTKEKGTGLGLAICQRIVKSHGGSVALAPRATLGGAEFIIRLPAIAEAKPATEPAVEATPNPDALPPPEIRALRQASRDRGQGSAVAKSKARRPGLG